MKNYAMKVREANKNQINENGDFTKMRGQN